MSVPAGGPAGGRTGATAGATAGDTAGGAEPATRAQGTATGPVIGQEAAAARLAALWSEGDGPHTVMLVGSEGVGRRPLARWFAASLACTRAGPVWGACGRCRDCVAILAGEHEDVREFRPQERTKTGKRKRDLEIVIDQMVPRPGGDPDPLLPWLMRRPRGRKRVAILDHAEALNLSAANAILKLLEEPPSWAVIVLIASAPEATLPTVASRATVVRLRPVDTTAFADLAPHPALDLGQLGPLLRVRQQPEAGPELEALQASVTNFVATLGEDLGAAVAAAEELARRADDAPSPTDVLRASLRSWPAGRYARALEAIDASEEALAAYANPALVYTVLAMRLRALAQR